MLFKKKIVFTEGMNETLCSFDEIPWFSCCGVPYDKPSYYIDEKPIGAIIGRAIKTN